MALDPRDLSTLSRLLDEAFDLDPAQVERWLAGLPAEQQRLVPRLRKMLAEHSSGESIGFLSAGPNVGGDTPDESVAHANDLVGPYRLIRELGRGGMGAVWLAERADGSLKRQIALKLPRLAWGAGLAERMARERDIGARLEHPNIARLYDAGVDERGRPYLALEYIPGEPLDAWCEAKALSIRDRLRLFIQVVGAVAYAHGRLVVHRDLKPSNVLVSADGLAHLLDFGIAKLLQEGAAGEGVTERQGRMLTPHFASPEQLSGEAVTVASDVYSLGVLLYLLLTGEHPYLVERRSLAALEEAVLHGEPALASSRVPSKTKSRELRGEIDSILGKALKRQPNERYATADAFGQDIERYLAGKTVNAQPDSTWYRARKTIVRHRFGFAATAAVLIAVIVGVGATVLQMQRATQQAERARVATEFVTELFRVNAAPKPSEGASDAEPTAFLDRGAQLIQTRFANQPDIQAELYGVVGRVYADIGANELAMSYANRQMAALDKLPEDRARRVRSLLLLADASYHQDKDVEAEANAGKAVALAESDDALWLESMAMLATIQLGSGEVAKARASTLAAEQRANSRSLSPSIGLARLLGVQALLLDYDNRFEDGTPVFRHAVDTALQLEGPQSRTAADLRLGRASAFMAHGHYAESRATNEAAVSALRSHGGADEIRAAIEAADFWEFIYFRGSATFSDVNEVIEKSRAFIAAQSSHVPPIIRAKLDFILACMYKDWGDMREAERLMSASVPILLAAPLRPSARGYIVLRQAVLAESLGQHEQADVLWRQHLELDRQLGVGNKADGAFDWSHVAFNLAEKGDADQAEAFLDKAPQFEIDASDEDQSLLVRTVALARARIRLDRGNVVGALEVLPDYQELGSRNQRDVDAEALYGEVRCAGGQPSEGLPLLLDATWEFEGTVGESSPDLARLRATTGLCALAIGDRPQALKLAQLARRAFIAQPGVATYYKAPLLKLEKALGIHVADGTSDAGTPIRLMRSR